VKPRNAAVAAAMAAAGIDCDIKILAADAKTAASAADQLGCEVGAIANSLVFECDGRPLLVMASGAHRVDTDLLARSLGATSIVDETLSGYRVVWTAAGTPDSVMPMTYGQLLTITEGVAMQVR
jgi:prolyl-tRNA editing enzyme YbaK/EbsC (Cys-tRNA(Pro) deacylase)